MPSSYLVNKCYGIHLLSRTLCRLLAHHSDRANRLNKMFLISQRQALASQQKKRDKKKLAHPPTPVKQGVSSPSNHCPSPQHCKQLHFTLPSRCESHPLDGSICLEEMKSVWLSQLGYYARNDGINEC